jgi:shikimate dehydrogenase
VTPIRGTTRVIAILGDPVEHSRSPAMHNAAFAALGLDYVYVPLRVRPQDLPGAIAGVRALGFAGLNVTVPHKEAIVALLDGVSPAARAIGAVNTVVRRGRRLVGYNTDGEGFLRAVRTAGFRPRGKRAVLLGAGGSARAAAWSLLEAGVGRILILNRHVDRASSLAARMRLRKSAIVEFGPLTDALRRDTFAQADLVVNCTSLGLAGKGGLRIAISGTPKHCLVYDLVYGARPTAFVAAARRRGRLAENGEAMLIEQARLAFRLWTGREPPSAVMRKALGLPPRSRSS